MMGRSVLAAPVIGTAALAACAAPAEQVAFTSAQEQACYERISATLPPNQSLRRNADGDFVRVTIVNGLLRDAERVPEFEACMVQVSGNVSFSDMGTITFTPAEQAIWDSLSDAARRDALEFIYNGGTLREFVGR